MTDLIAELVRSGRVVDIALGLILLEAAVLAVLQRRGGRPMLSAGPIAHLAAGACLLLALRAALVGAGWQPVAGWLLGGLLAHAIDLRARLRGGD